jgi:hypothetical protein
MTLGRLLGTMALLTLPLIPSDSFNQDVPLTPEPTEQTTKKPTLPLEDITFEPSQYTQKFIEERADSILARHWEKSNIEKRLSRLSRICDLIGDSNYDENFIYAHLSVESEGHFDAVSSSKASGVAQFKKGTARESGIKITPFYDGRKDPVETIPGYEVHLTTISDRTDSEDSLEKVLTIYLNGLYSNQKRQTDRKTGEDLFSSLSKTTRDYIIEVGAVKYLLDNGLLDFERQPLLSEKISPNKRRVRKGETIYSIGRREGLPPKKILEVNPGLIPEKMPAGYLLSMPEVE